jgi:hypothetical protein
MVVRYGLKKCVYYASENTDQKSAFITDQKIRIRKVHLSRTIRATIYHVREQAVVAKSQLSVKVQGVDFCAALQKRSTPSNSLAW